MIAIGTVLSFFLRPTSFLAPLAAGAIAGIIGFGGGFAKGYGVAVSDHKVGSLQRQIAEMRQASEAREKILEEDAELANHHQAEVARLHKLVKDIQDATPTANDHCKLTALQLQQLKSVLAN